jgi:hypothetical protein
VLTHSYNAASYAHGNSNSNSNSYLDTGSKASPKSKASSRSAPSPDTALKERLTGDCPFRLTQRDSGVVKRRTEIIR